MIELNKWFFIQLANFLVLLVILNYLLFKPILNLFRERKEGIEGAIEEAKKLNELKDQELKRYHTELRKAREEAQKIYNSLREEGLNVQKDLISQAQKEAMEEIEKAKKVIQEETEKARAKLREYAERFSEEIIRKLVGV